MRAENLWSLPALVLLCVLSLLPCGNSFQEGDFVPIARRGQFQEVRCHAYVCAGAVTSDIQPSPRWPSLEMRHRSPNAGQNALA